MTITEKNLAEKLAGAYINNYSWVRVARTAAELLGHEFAPEPKPLPTEPGSAIIATEVRGVKGRWRMLRGVGRRWYSVEPIGGYHWHSPDRITAWTEAHIVPVAAAPVTLTEDQVGEFHEVARLKDPAGARVAPFNGLPEAVRAIHTATVNALLSKYAAPAEDMPDWDDVRNAVASQRGNGWSLNDAAINGITDAVMRLLHREEA